MIGGSGLGEVGRELVEEGHFHLLFLASVGHTETQAQGIQIKDFFLEGKAQEGGPYGMNAEGETRARGYRQAHDGTWASVCVPREL